MSEPGLAIMDPERERARKKANGQGRQRFPRVWIDEAAVGDGAEYLVKGIIERGKLVYVYGPPGDGKTFFTIDVCAHIAAGIPWRGKRVNQGVVVYVASEAGASIARRFVAWREQKLAEDREGPTPLCILTRGPNLLDKVDVAALIEELKEIGKEADAPVVLVIFDTLSRSMPGGDENQSRDTTEVIGASDRIRDEIGAAVGYVHHTGKDASQGLRGHSSLLGSADAVIKVNDRIATVEKARDSTAGEQFPFELEVIDLGLDADGDEITTCVVRPSEGGATSKRIPKLSGAASVGLTSLQEAITAHGQLMPGSSTIPEGVRATTLEAWREQFRLRYGAQANGETREAGAVKVAFQRARDKLLGDKIAVASAPYVWIGYAG